MVNPSRDPTAKLLDAARQGDRQAQAELFQAFASYLNLITRLQVNQQFNGRVSPSDVVQDVFLRAGERFGEFRGTTEAELMAWLRRLLASRLASLARYHLAGRRDVRLEERLCRSLEQSSQDIAHRLPSRLESPSRSAANREQGVLLAAMLDQLPADYREVIVLRHLEGKPFAEIAQMMGRTLPSVKSIWTRAVSKLRLLIGEDPTP